MWPPIVTDDMVDLRFSYEDFGQNLEYILFDTWLTALTVPSIRWLSDRLRTMLLLKELPWKWFFFLVIVCCCGDIEGAFAFVT